VKNKPIGEPKEKKVKKEKVKPAPIKKKKIVVVQKKKIVEQDFTKKITTAKQDDWIAKIKVI